MSRMGRRVGAPTLPYYSSYDHDKMSISRLIALLLRRSGNKDGYAVRVEHLSKKEVDDVYCLEREEWYKKAKSVGLFPSFPDNDDVFKLYEEIYERIKAKYGEKRRCCPHHRNIPYWLPYFYFQKRRAYFLKPKEECIEIMRGLVCPVFDDIKKKFEKTRSL